MNTGNPMEIVYIYDPNDNTYLGLNVTNQTSTGWHRDYEVVKSISLGTTRQMEGNFSNVSNLSLEELLTYIDKHGIFKLHDIYIDNGQPQPYEYW